MALSLDDKVESLVSDRRKKEQELPDYFNSALGTDLKISRDFEAFLILQNDAARNEIIKWLSKARTLEETNADRDKLVVEAISLDLADATQRQTEIATKIQEFTAFKSVITSPQKNAVDFSGVPEVQLLLRDLQGAMPEIALRRDRLTHQVTMDTLLQKNVTGQSDNDKKQLDSWSEVISVYSL